MGHIQDLRFQEPLEVNFHSLEALFEYMMMIEQDLVQGEISVNYKEPLHFSNTTLVSLANLLHPQPYFLMPCWALPYDYHTLGHKDPEHSL